MESTAGVTPAGLSHALHVQIAGADAEPVPASEIARLFPRVPPLSPRFERLARSSRVVVTRNGTVLGLAVYVHAGEELRVHDMAIAAPAACTSRGVLHLLLDALEAACLAGGARRIVLVPPPRAHAVLRRRGYETVSEGCAGMWMEKSLG